MFAAATTSVTANPAPARVALADPDAYARRELRRILAELPEFSLAPEEATNAEETRALCCHLRPALLLLAPPVGVTLVQFLGDLKGLSPQTRIVILALTADGDLALTLTAAHGYVFKQEPPAMLIEAMRTVLRGGMGYSRVALDLLARERRVAPDLEEREWQLLRCLMTGMEDREIARVLGQSTGSVRNDLSKLYAALGVRNRLQAAVWGWQQRWAAWREVEKLP